MANINDIDFKQLNQDGKDFLQVVTSMTDAFNQLSQGSKDLANQLGVSKTQLSGARDLAAEMANISEKDLKTKEGIDRLQSKVNQAQKDARKLAQEISILEAKRVNASQSQQKAINELLRLKQDELDTNREVLENVENITQNLGQQNDLLKNAIEFADKFVGILSAGSFIKFLLNLDNSLTQTARNLNLSKDEAISLKQEFAAVSLNSEDIAVNSERLLKANQGLNDQLGTATVFSSDLLITYSKLTEIVGLSAEAAGSLAFQAQRSGESFREVEENTLAASYNLQQSAGVALNNKEILEATGKVTGQVRANLGANPEAISRAVTQAKLFGAELDDIVASSKALLDFESSIENELSAELLTGKQLNLERARALSLAGDQEGLARELTAQAGNFTEFSKLNVLQQEELAKAFGMSSDRLSDILFKQETQNMNAQQLRDLGKDELADRLEQLSTQDKINLAQEKLQTIIGDMATIFLPIVEGFGAMVGYLAENKVAAIALGSVLTGLAVSSVVSAVANIFSSLSQIPFGIGIPIAAAAVAGLFATINSAKQQAVADGIAPPGNGPFTITDSYGRTAVTATGDGLAVSPNINKGGSGQPVVIQNTFSNFQASGPYALAETQRRQASPTFA
jgi:hypothetical protein